MNRMSSLPLAQYCGLVGDLQKKYGNGRAAVKGTYFHGLHEGKAPKDLPWLSPEELADMEAWHQFEFPEESVHEATVAFCGVVRPDGKLVFFFSHDEQPDMCVGHVDVYWKEVDEWGQDYLRVVDIKTGPPEFYSPQSLQITTYAAVLCRMCEVEYAYPGIAFARTGEIVYGDRIDRYETDEYLEKAWKAATNISETGTTGTHCDGCFQRLHCHEYQSVKAPADINTNEDALSAILELDALKKAYEALEKRLHTYADDTGGIINGTKVWGPSPRKGRESANVAQLRKALGRDAEQFISTGKPYMVYSWLKKQ